MESKKKLWSTIEKGITIALFMLLTGLLILEILYRIYKLGAIKGSSEYIKHLVLLITFVGAMITTREKRHLAMGVGQNLLKGKASIIVKNLCNIITMAILTILFFTSLFVLLVGFNEEHIVGIFPVQVFAVIMPLGFLVMIIRSFIYMDGSKKDKWVASIGIIIGLIIIMGSFFNNLYTFLNNIGVADDELLLHIDNLYVGYADFFFPFIQVMFWPLFGLFIIAAFFGTPIFIVLGGITVIISSYMGNQMSQIPLEAYDILTNDKIPAIPLFTLAGFILSESKAGERLVRLFDATLGWMPGGLAIVTVLVCAFFTTFTGASGVTILALGGLLSYMLKKDGYDKNFNEGLITGAGSIGLLFPPSLPIIMYGVAALIDVRKLFIAGIIPGIIMVAAVAVIGIIYAVKNKIERSPFRWKKAVKAFVAALGEIGLPVTILILYFGGITTLVETGAVAVIYTLVLEVFIYKDIKFKDLHNPFVKSIPIIGGILIIMAVAKALSSNLVDIPILFAEWMKAHVSSPIIFLMLLNLMLLLTGCVMDIFAAIIVMAPIVIELGRVYGIDPTHLGIIFLANLQIGYLTPPVGLNLFLASYRFEAPLSRIYKNVVPFFLVLLIAVLLTTYVPFLSTGLLNWIKF